MRLNVPEVGATELTFGASNKAELEAWVADLPLVNTAETAVQLDQAIVEIAMLDAVVTDKLEFLEILRPTVHYICTRLDRQNITQPSQQPNAAATAQSLLENLCIGYKTVVLPLLKELNNTEDSDTRSSRDKQDKKDRKEKKDKQDEGKQALQIAVHRLISDMSRTLLRTLQHYIPTPNHFWLEINGLYRLCEERLLIDFRCRDEENHGVSKMSINEVYLRVLLLAACKPNQLNQEQLTLTFNTIELWASQVMLVADTDDALLCIDLAGDHGPQFFKLSDDQQSPRALPTEVLAYEIEAYLKQINRAVEIPETFPNKPLSHLVEAWSVMQPRAFQRLPASGPIRVCIGMRSCHYFLSGGIEFASQLTDTDSLLRREINPFLELEFENSDGTVTPTTDDGTGSQDNDLDDANPDESKRVAANRESKAYPAVMPFLHFETQALDTSPGGYCIRWGDGLPDNCRVGELIALREERDTRWCVATIRWIRHQGDEAAMGVALLSPRAIPVAIRMVYKRGGPTDFTRAFLLPEIGAIRQAATLITPRMPFAAGQKLQIQRQGIQTTGQLIELQLNTESVNQFTFRMLDGYLENSRTDRNIGDLSEMTREDST